MFTIIPRFLPLLIGTVWLMVAWSDWNIGIPPAWTFFMPRDSTVVRETGLAVEPTGNGAMRYRPVVVVEWPRGGATTAELGSVQNAADTGERQNAEPVLAEFPVGATIAVIVYQGAPYADRIDWASFGRALFPTVLGLPLFGLGLFLVIALRWR